MQGARWKLGVLQYLGRSVWESLRRGTLLVVEVTARRQRNSFEIFFNCSFASQLGWEKLRATNFLQVVLNLMYVNP